MMTRALRYDGARRQRTLRLRYTVCRHSGGAAAAAITAKEEAVGYDDGETTR